MVPYNLPLLCQTVWMQAARHATESNRDESLDDVYDVITESIVQSL